MKETQIITGKYANQIEKWPKEGGVILSQYDETSIIVYQAYNSQIANFAAKNQYFEEGFNFNRMSWIKTNFLWMMYRSNWGRKDNQERILAIRIPRNKFENIISLAVPSSFNSSYSTESEWRQLLHNSEVRLQWDPDHDPYGNKISRRAIQLGLRNHILYRFSKEFIISIEDITEFVQNQRINVDENNLYTPLEREYIFLNLNKSTCV